MAYGPNWNEGAPCRVSGDLRRHQAEQNRAEPSEHFDECDIEHVEAVVGKRFAPSVQSLLLTLRDVLAADGSFGADPNRCVEVLRPQLKALRAACVDEWRDL